MPTPYHVFILDKPTMLSAVAGTDLVVKELLARKAPFDTALVVAVLLVQAYSAAKRVSPRDTLACLGGILEAIESRLERARSGGAGG